MTGPTAGGRADQERAQKAMVAALRWPSPLRQRLSKCGEDGHWMWNEWRCHSPACVRCRGRYTRKQERQLSAALGDATNADLSMFTIMFDVASEADDIGPIWLKAKSDLRNRVNAMRRTNPRWDRVAMTGWVEADPIIYDDMARLGTQQRAMLAGLNTPCWRADGGPAWVVHIHGITYHPKIDWQETQAALSAQWQGERRVHVQPFDASKGVDTNIGGVVRYATKYRAGRWMGGGFDYWPAAWMAEYYDWADRFSQGWQSMRFRMNGKAMTDSCEDNNALSIDLSYIEPMYTTSSFNSYPILYTDGGQRA